MLKKSLNTTGPQEPVTKFFALTRAAFEGSEKILHLNVKHMKANLADSSEAVGDLLSATTPQTFTMVTLMQSRQAFGKMLAHCTEMANLTTRTQASLMLLLGASLQPNSDA
jgi:phasin family protein